jgi:hypothetical protein
MKDKKFNVGSNFSEGSIPIAIVCVYSMTANSQISYSRSKYAFGVHFFKGTTSEDQNRLTVVFAVGKSEIKMNLR